MSNFFDLIKARRSTRKFLDKPISAELKEKLLNAVLMSPASKRSNPWSFVVVEESEQLQKLAECKPAGSKLIAGAAMAIVVLADPSKSDVWIEDASIASIYLQLAAEELGLGSCWVQVRKRAHSEEQMAEAYIKSLLEIPAEMEVESVVAFGYKEKENKPFDESKLLKERIYWGTYKG